MKARTSATAEKEKKRAPPPPPSSSSPSSSRSSSASSTTSNNSSSSNNNNTNEKRRWRDRLIPEFLQRHGRTVYGGNPIVQQTLPGLFNYPSPYWMIPLFFALAVSFVVVGAVMMAKSSHHYSVEVPYSQIHQYQYIPSDPAVNVNQGLRVFTADGVDYPQGTRTWLRVELTSPLKAPVYWSYKIDNMHQNFRDYHDGRSLPQLVGKKKLGDNYRCKPFEYPGFLDGTGDSTPVTIITTSGETVTKMASDFTYNPCGMAPWSMFNDTFTLYREATGAEGGDVVMGGKDGATPLTMICNGTDFDIHGNPLGGTAENHCAKKGISRRADITHRYYNLTLREDWWSLYYPNPTTNDYLRQGWYLHEAGHALPDPMDLDLQVWMRAAALPSFLKLYRIIDVDLEPGVYHVSIDEFFDTVTFRGNKSVVLRTSSWVGAENTALSVVYVVLGCLCFVFGVAFSIEWLLRRGGCAAGPNMKEPRRSWYVFDKTAEEFVAYYQLRLRKKVPLAELQALRLAVEEMEQQVLEEEQRGAGEHGHGSAAREAR